jgi:L-alanine-DL-glutamate epimerase-like enolase superfamily enzyme
MKKDVTKLNRREFIKAAGMGTSLALSGLDIAGSLNLLGCMMNQKEITIETVDSNFEREPLIRPFGFKGGYMSEIWQTIAYLRAASGIHKIGLCTQNVLWSDAAVFASCSESGGNALMYTLTDYALKLLKGTSFRTPIELLDKILPEVYEYGKFVTANRHLRKTFALNALVGLDNAAWLLYAQENGLTSFDDMIPETYKPSLSHRHKQVASIPLMAYSIPISEIVEAVEQGYFFMKIKIGQPGTQQEMLQKDMDRLSSIHKAIGNKSTTYTKNGKLPYYFDANGRYESKETLLKLLDHAKRIGAFEQIAVVEEPFPEEMEIDVHDIPVRLAADESAHTDEDARNRIDMGYKAIALKAIAKTLSMTMKIAQIAHGQKVPCFCADLTVNPILVDWNKNVASRLAPFPDFELGLLETNGHQNYKNWQMMCNYRAYDGASWTKTAGGVFNLDKNYYLQSGGILQPSPHYEAMFVNHSR